jgi:mRNA interferase YafQ
MKFQIKTTSQFRKAYRKCIKRGLDIQKLDFVLNMLVNGDDLPSSYRRHKLSGKYKDCWECHVDPDWLLVWMENNQELVLLLVDTGSHSDLFG